MDQQSSSNDKDKLTTITQQRLSLPITDRRDSITSSSRTCSPVAFFHDSITINKLDLHGNFMGAQRRAQAIATAPRRKRHDDDKDEEVEQTKTLESIKTSALSIPIPVENQHPHSLPKIQLHTSLLPTFRVDPPPSQDNCEQLDYTFNHKLRLTRYSSAPLPSRNEDWKN